MLQELQSEWEFKRIFHKEQTILFILEGIGKSYFKMGKLNMQMTHTIVFILLLMYLFSNTYKSHDPNGLWVECKKIKCKNQNKNKSSI